MNDKKSVVLGITGGIAAIKSVELITRLQQDGYDVTVVMTESATHIVSLEKLADISSNKVYTTLFEEDFSAENIVKNRTVDHIALADKADIVLIAPVTANMIAKVAYGLADDFLTTVCLATQAPIILAPSMNVHMWKNPVVQDNLQKLKNRGFTIIEPEAGPLACGYDGKGRLASIETILKVVAEQLQKSNSLSGKKILITAGGTSEPIDAVRNITNKSSGKMGIALAKAAKKRGADVLLLKSSTAVSADGISQEKFVTLADLSALIKKHIKSFDILIHAAAVSDFRVINAKTEKIGSTEPVTLSLQPTEKISDEIKKLNPKISFVLFKAEHVIPENDLITAAKEKLEKANADVVIANDVGKKGIGFGADENEVICILENGQIKKLDKKSKQVLADEILDVLIEQKII